MAHAHVSFNTKDPNVSLLPESTFQVEPHRNAMTILDTASKPSRLPSDPSDTPLTSTLTRSSAPAATATMSRRQRDPTLSSSFVPIHTTLSSPNVSEGGGVGASSSSYNAAAGGGGGGHSISFSTLPAGRSPSESSPSRRMNEISPNSPARSLAQVPEASEAVKAARSLQGHGHDNASAEGFTWGTDASAVQVQPQRGRHGHHSGRPPSGAGSTWCTGSSLPESRFSEFEVVYDDGVRKQRTFSLTTELDDDEHRSSSNEDDDNDDAAEDSPLLAYSSTHPAGYGTSPQYRLHSNSFGNGSHPFAFLTATLSTAWQRITQYNLSLPHKRILKASLAYLCGCLVSFTPLFLPYIGVSGHLAATSAVFFNPAKTLGRMVEAVTEGLCAIGFGILVCVGSMLSAVWFNTRDMYIWGHVVSVIVFGGGSTFIIAYAKAHFNRPTVNVGKYLEWACI
ncbi:hypothetical protein BGZ65_005986 [Modicella reniformis]|uniref:Uncharacterized protein n=1 Tax=Modicella reniformis TaxID=1440133 RepID=A0A9P6LRG0_9FUNG|nr:hypothetical protein BGZ65_005986 [Modicella reniformis]